jgi:hypothetical protein
VLASLTELAFAAFIGWEILRYITFITISGRIAPVIVIVLAFCLSFLPHRELLSVAAAGGVALLIKLIDPDSVMPLRYSLDFFRDFGQAWRDRYSHRTPPL